MKQTLLIGLGGTGSRTVNNVKKVIQKNPLPEDEGKVVCVVLDTNQNDNNAIIASQTGIPVIPTCDNRAIDEYFSAYAHKEPIRWSPYTPTFGRESMIDGASEMRIKSRIAFMDVMGTTKINALKNIINQVLINRPNEPDKIRVIIVSSLSGGTGSGMFIQVALWLRKYFESINCLSNIRGVFMLPDIFVDAVANIGENSRKKMYQYGNAYAAIRELNAINKIIKGNYTPALPIIIDDLFDSRDHTASAVFDNAFFIDNRDSLGVALPSVEAYEEIVAQMVYMQLYAPMASEMHSVEDNLFRSFESNPEPVFGSSGASRAIFPFNDVVRYCALRASKESIKEGWTKIDSEIKAKKDEEAEKIKDGKTVKNPIVTGEYYVKLFDEWSNKKEALGRGDRLFVSLKNDIYNEKKTSIPGTGEVNVIYTGKVTDLLANVGRTVEKAVTEQNDYQTIVGSISADLPDKNQLSEYSGDQKDGLVKKLKGLRTNETGLIEGLVDAFDDKADGIAETIIDSLVPLDMNSVNQYNDQSLYGLFWKKTADEQEYHVHPIVARYLLYKLEIELNGAIRRMTVEQSRNNALAGDATVSFDNTDTHKQETRDNYWEKVGKHVSTKEIAFFVAKYKEYNQANALLVQQYETELVTLYVYKELLKKIRTLIDKIETLFRSFDRIVNKLDEDLKANIAADLNGAGQSKVLYVFADEMAKAYKYDQLDIDLVSRNDQLHKTVIDTVYGKFCCEYRPGAQGNKPYEHKSVAQDVYDGLLDYYKDAIMDRRGKYREQVDLSIIRAIKEESDYKQLKTKERLELDGEETDVFGEADAEAAAHRYDAAIKKVTDDLFVKAAPFLIAQPDEALAVIRSEQGITMDETHGIWMQTANGERIRVPYQTKHSFWGYNPAVGAEYPAFAGMLGVNGLTSANIGYKKNEIYCYRSIYGVTADKINKFREDRGGEDNYYYQYSAIINRMIGPRGTPVDNPHIDKTWYTILPYISEARRRSADSKFYITVLRAIAYGRLTLDNRDNFQLSRIKIDAYGREHKSAQPLLEGGRTISATEISRMFTALRLSPEFENEIAPQLEERYLAERAGLNRYVDTDIVKGLLRDDKLNPVSMLVRFNASRLYNEDTAMDFMGALYEIMHDLASNYDLNRTKESIELAANKLLLKIYLKSDMKDKKTVFSSWLEKFKELGLIKEDGSENESAVNGADTEGL